MAFDIVGLDIVSTTISVRFFVIVHAITRDVDLQPIRRRRLLVGLFIVVFLLVAAFAQLVL